MGIINNGVLGGVSGKIGGVVGANWKGIPYLKAYAVPANPNTPAQQAQRATFSFCVAFAKSLLQTVINKFWLNKMAFMSAYNAFQKANMSFINATTGVTKDNLLTTGSLEGVVTSSGTYDIATGAVIITWDPAILGAGLATDKILIAVYDKDNLVSFVRDGQEERAAGTSTFNIGVGRSAVKCIGFIAAYRGTAPNYMTSQSTGFQITPA